MKNGNKKQECRFLISSPMLNVAVTPMAFKKETLDLMRIEKYYVKEIMVFVIHPTTALLLQEEQELQEVLKFPIEIFWNLEASLKSELSYF